MRKLRIFVIFTTNDDFIIKISVINFVSDFFLIKHIKIISLEIKSKVPTFTSLVIV